MRQGPRPAPESPAVTRDETAQQTTGPVGGRSVFALDERLAAKADPRLVAADEAHFAAIARTLEETLADLADRLDAARRGTDRHGDRKSVV